MNTDKKPITNTRAMNAAESLGLQHGQIIAPKGLGSEPNKPLMEKVNATECGPRDGIAPKNFRWITDQLPDSEMTVLMRKQDEEFPIWPGFHDGENWCDCDASTVEVPVLGWMELEEAAAIIDGKPRPASGERKS